MSEETQGNGWRHRINVTRNTKGYSFECTVEGEGKLMEDVIEESKKLVENLEKQYPREIPA